MNHVKTAVAVLMAYILIVLPAGAHAQNRAKALDEMIAHFKTTETRLQTLIEKLERGTVIMVRNSSGSLDYTPVLTADLRELAIAFAMSHELGLKNANAEDIERRALERANRFIAAQRTVSREAITKLQEQLSQARKSRLLAQKEKDKLASAGNSTTDNDEDLSGTWKVHITTPWSYYDYRWDITKSSPTEWKAEQTLLATNHPHQKPMVGQKFHSYTLTKTKTSYLLYGSGGDSNPANPGAFKQTAELTLKNGRLAGKGEHKGTSLTHFLNFDGGRAKTVQN